MAFLPTFLFCYSITFLSNFPICIGNMTLSLCPAHPDQIGKSVLPHVLINLGGVMIPDVDSANSLVALVSCGRCLYIMGMTSLRSAKAR